MDSSAKTLAASHARVVTYNALIVNAQEAYRDYLARHSEAGRVHRLINGISK